MGILKPWQKSGTQSVPAAAQSAAGKASAPGRTAPPPDGHTRELFWHTLLRLVFLYFVPLVLVALFYQFQYRQLIGSSLRARLSVTAEHHALLFDLFLRERLANLGDIAGDLAAPGVQLDNDLLDASLARLQRVNEAFVDIGVVDETGRLIAYAGPVRYPEGFNYQREEWLQDLVSGRARTVITDIYLGFRGRPHFTIAMLQTTTDGVQVLRAALSPERLAEYLTGMEGADEVMAGVVNAHGTLQVSTARLGEPLTASGFVPPREPWLGFVRGQSGSVRAEYAYGWLHEAPWALVVTAAPGMAGTAGVARPPRALLPALALFLVMGVVILVRTRQVVGRQLATEMHEAELSGQLVHAAKLASVGELAAGIAHEINNPLAIIAEEVGELQDALDPAFASEQQEPVDFGEHLDSVLDAVYRCRDITRKLLTFVRQTDVKLERLSVHAVIDDVLDTMLANELLLSNVQVVRSYVDHPAEAMIDRNQLVQVFVNLVKNAIDAMPGGGVLTVSSAIRGESIAVSVRDTGCGMTAEHLERVFTPFFTTKDPGMGTGLGLSVSYMIIQNLGGAFYVDSVPGKGSVFSVELPLA